jgi:hypothetical protein
LKDGRHKTIFFPTEMFLRLKGYPGICSWDRENPPESPVEEKWLDEQCHV